MLIDQFINFLQEASQWPQSFWGHKFYLARKSFISQLGDTKSSFKEKDTSAYKSVMELISLLNNKELDELRLAEEMQNLSSFFVQSGKKDKKIQQFSLLADKFLNRARLFANYQKKRQQLNLDGEQKNKFDQKLFANEGIFYCLEYYLAVYKKMSELKKDSEKEKFFTNKEIDLGFGGLPGLKADFAKDEVLEKFVLLILSNAVRERLLISYYACRNIALDEKIRMIEFEKAFRKFIYYLLLAFKENGVEKLSSKFFKPYGEQPSILELTSIFEAYE